MTAIDDAFTAIDTALAEVRALFAKSELDNVTLFADNVAKADLIDALTVDRDLWKTEAARLQAKYEPVTPPPPPPVDPPPPPALRFPTLGACPINGGGTLLTVESKWGDGPERPVIGRYFDADNPSGIGTRPPIADMPSVVYSAKPDHVLTDAELIAIGGYLTQPTDLFCPWHEPDVKWKKLVKSSGQAAADAALAQWLNIQTEAAKSIARLRAAGKIKYDSINISGGWIFTSDTSTAKFVPTTPATYAGFDLDGTTNTTGSYFDWSQAAILNRINAFVAGHGYKGWLVTEYSWTALTADTTRAQRVAAITAQVPKILAAGALSIVVYDYDNNPGEALRTSPEITAMKAAVPAELTAGSLP